MKMDEILAVIKSLAGSQGFYGRLLNAIEEIEQQDADRYNELVKTLEAQNFNDPVDFVMYIES